MAVQFVIDIRFDVFKPFPECGQPEMPHVDARQEVEAKAALPDRGRAREGAPHVPEEIREHAFALKRRAVHFHEDARNQPLVVAEFINLSGKVRFAGPGGAGKQDGAVECVATCSMSSIILLKTGLRVSMDDLRKVCAATLCFSESAMLAIHLRMSPS